MDMIRKALSLRAMFYTIVGGVASVGFFVMAWNKYTVTNSLDEAMPGIILGIVFTLYTTWPWSIPVIVILVIVWLALSAWYGPVR